jgi:hypothetical protein
MDEAMSSKPVAPLFERMESRCLMSAVGPSDLGLEGSDSEEGGGVGGATQLVSEGGGSFYIGILLPKPILRPRPL